jgi:hypothetical protein
MKLKIELRRQNRILKALGLELRTTRGFYVSVIDMLMSLDVFPSFRE